MKGALLWVGPVSPGQFGGPLPEGYGLVTVGSIVAPPGRDLAHDGVRPTDFRAYYATLGPDPVGALLARVGSEKLLIASFSAGHGLVERLLAEHANDPRIAGVALLDSFYGLDEHDGTRAFARRAMATGEPLWVTTSRSKDGTITLHSGSESFAPMATSLGLAPRELDTKGLGLPLPVSTMGRGGVVWLDYGATIAHGSHASLASAVTRAITSRQERRGEDGSGGVLGGLLTVLALLWAARRRKA